MAMAIFNDDDMKEDSVYPPLRDSLNLNHNEQQLSLEDVAWVDSCLNKDVDASDTDWSSIKNVLLEILTADKSIDPATDDGICRYTGNIASLERGRGSNDDDDYDEDLIDEDVGEDESIEYISEDDDEDRTSGNTSRRARSKVRFDGVFRPNYTEDMENVDYGLDSSLTKYDTEPSPVDIFKVWDLGVCDEQDDFTKQLTKALAEIPSQIQPPADDSSSWKDLMNVSVDDLIAGVADLSLTGNTK